MNRCRWCSQRGTDSTSSVCACMPSISVFMGLDEEESAGCAFVRPPLARLLLLVCIFLVFQFPSSSFFPFSSHSKG
ncbi:hypothetical protein IE53DRAFT_128280 [Violaceomyces palustris]|uniref:Uncharacterized protein n=1 Tax=Violaceomyces palustris TaxID=1673888 RepID=A0ACD0NVM6_9BASI|nr:hypothetical protein IE53DRAFT_128280 [Violaceomyces palustris]